MHRRRSFASPPQRRAHRLRRTGCCGLAAVALRLFSHCCCSAAACAIALAHRRSHRLFHSAAPPMVTPTMSKRLATWTWRLSTIYRPPRMSWSMPTSLRAPDCGKAPMSMLHRISRLHPRPRSISSYPRKRRSRRFPRPISSRRYARMSTPSSKAKSSRTTTSTTCP
jgi:hypothetical protein